MPEVDIATYAEPLGGGHKKPRGRPRGPSATTRQHALSARSGRAQGLDDLVVVEAAIACGALGPRGPTDETERRRWARRTLDRWERAAPDACALVNDVYGPVARGDATARQCALRAAREALPGWVKVYPTAGVRFDEFPVSSLASLPAEYDAVATQLDRQARAIADAAEARVWSIAISRDPGYAVRLLTAKSAELRDMAAFARSTFAEWDADHDRQRTLARVDGMTTTQYARLASAEQAAIEGDVGLDAPSAPARTDILSRLTVQHSEAQDGARRGLRRRPLETPAIRPPAPVTRRYECPTCGGAHSPADHPRSSE